MLSNLDPIDYNLFDNLKKFEKFEKIPSNGTCM